MSAHDDYLDPDRAGINDEQQDNDHVEAAFPEYAGPHDLYRSTYRSSDCGANVGFTFLRWEADEYDEPIIEWVNGDPVQTGTVRCAASKRVCRTVYGDDLRDLGTWADWAKRGDLIQSIHVTSIVEGVEQTTDEHIIPADADMLEQHVTGDEDVSACLSRLFEEAVDAVEEEAEAIWNATHGCEECADHHGIKWEPGDTPVWSECPGCGGTGAII